MVVVAVIIKIAIDYFRSSSKVTAAGLTKWVLASNPAQTLPEQTQAQQFFYQRLNHFSATMYAKMAFVKCGKNFIFFTPNLLTILSLIYAGAPDQLKQRFSQEFGIDTDFTEQMFYDEQAAYNTNLGNRSGTEEEKKSSLLPSLFTSKTQTTLTKLVYQISNAALIRNDAAPNLEKVRHQFEVMQFEKTKEAETKANQWVSQKTEGKITDLVQDLDPTTVFILVTASLFAGKWIHPFNKNNTEKANFYNADGTTVVVDAMRKGTDHIRYSHFTCGETGFNILELPFHGNVSPIVAKPNKPYSYQGKFDYEAHMNTLMEEENLENLRTYISSSKFEKREGLDILIPKFTSSDQVDLLKDLRGWDLMQHIEQADFNGSLVAIKKDAGSIAINRIVSRTLFQMEESGVQLAAASYSPSALQSCSPRYIIIRLLSMTREKLPPVRFHSNIRTQKTILHCSKQQK